MPVNKQIVNTIKKSFSKFDFSSLEEKCTNEAQTRFILIEPILEVLGYSRIDDMTTEMNAGWGKKNDKADIGLIINGKTPEIIIECKKFGKRLTDKEASQLNNYFINTKNTKCGILTNGMEWRVYFPNDSTKEDKLYEVPYLTLDFNNINDELLETLSKFHKNNIDIKELYDEAQDFYFLEGFSSALALELSDPSDDFIKAIFNRMEGKRMTDQIKSKLKNLINSTTIQNVLPFVVENESKNGNMIITTFEELKIYHAIKTTILSSLKKVESDRISYRDQKNSFNILVDGNNKKLIAKITCQKSKYFIEINNTKYEYNGLNSIVALKKQLIESIQQYLI